MKRKCTCLLVLASVAASPVLGQSMIGSEFTYQGRLVRSGMPVDDTCNVTFRLYDAPAGGAQVGTSPIGPLPILVSEGLFTVPLDFGDVAFNGDPRWLEIATQCPGDPMPTILTPRQEMTPAPYSAFADLASRAEAAFRIETGSSRSDVATLLFGPTDDCSIGIDSAGPSGLRLRDPSGIRVLSGSTTATIRFGPTDDCSIGVDTAGAAGLTLKDPAGARICRPPSLPPGPTFLRFGPTDDCSIGIDPALSGLSFRDPSGIRLINPTPLLLPTRILFGPTDDCSIGIDPMLSGLVERDPVGLRLLGPGSTGRLLFGPTDLCSISIDPPGGSMGLNLRDPKGVRILLPDGIPPAPSRLLFGPTDDCSIGIDPALSGLSFRDPSGIRLINPDPLPAPTRLLFGPTDDCSIGIDPAFPGLVERDPIGLRLLGPSNMGGRLLFGPTDDCTISVDPGGPSGLMLRDPAGIRVLLPPGTTGPSRLLFGPTDDCSIGIDPAFPGLVERDPIGLRLLGPSNMGGRLLFGPTDGCTISVDPGGPSGLMLRDPAGIRLVTPAPMAPTRLLFGPTDDCSILVDPAGPSGLTLRDPAGIRVLNPAAGTNRLVFGPQDLCDIRVEPLGSPLRGMRFRDPSGFAFEQGNMAVGVANAGFRVELPNTANPGGQGFANAWINASSRRWKENIRPIAAPLTILRRLEGVQFDWKAEQGGKSDLGFIAEDVAAVCPELVVMEENGVDAKGMNYSHLLAVAVEGIKEQQKQIRTLRAENEELKNEMAELRSRLKSIAIAVQEIGGNRPGR